MRVRLWLPLEIHHNSAALKATSIVESQHFFVGLPGRSVMQRTDAQFYLYKRGFLDDELWEMRLPSRYMAA